MLAQYNDVFPGCAERIVTMAENQASHRHRLESVVVQGNIAAEKRGQYFAFLLGAIAIVGGIYLIATGKEVAGYVSIISAIGGLSGVFVWGRIRQERERKKKEAAVR